MSVSLSPVMSTTSPEQALSETVAAVVSDGNEKDLAYLLEHRVRFERTLRRLSELAPRGARILDVGSHYLHTSTALRLMGYEVWGMDVGVFANAPLMQARAGRFGIENRAVNGFDQGDFLNGETDRFDAVVFTEIQEHITFNPVLFWRRIYELLRVGGIVYITTPNSITPWKTLHVLKRLATRQGIGLTAPEILDTVTYGHHWKEYSAHEIRDIFRRLSPDFDVSISHFNHPTVEAAQGHRSIKGAVRGMVHRLSSKIPGFRDQIEAVVRVRGKTAWLVNPPNFI